MMSLKKKIRLALVGLATLLAFGAAGSAEAASHQTRKHLKKTSHHHVVKKKSARVKASVPVKKAVTKTFVRVVEAAQRFGTYACALQPEGCMEVAGRSLNKHARIEPASLNKIMTAGLLEKYRLEQGKNMDDYCLTITQADRLKGMKGERGGVWSYMGGGVLKTADLGTRLTFREAELALTVKSANDVAVATARIVSGSEDAFAEKMTAQARAYGTLNTTFKNASGMPQTGQVSTPYDMAQIWSGMARAFGEDKMRDLFGQRSAKIAGSVIETHIPDLRSGRVVAAKTGTISGVSNIVATGHDHTVAVVMGAASGAARSVQLASVLGISHVASSKGSTAKPVPARTVGPAATAPASGPVAMFDGSSVAPSGPTVVAALMPLVGASYVSAAPSVSLPVPETAVAFRRVADLVPVSSDKIAPQEAPARDEAVREAGSRASMALGLAGF